jgi:hypothetical protein
MAIAELIEDIIAHMQSSIETTSRTRPEVRKMAEELIIRGAIRSGNSRQKSARPDSRRHSGSDLEWFANAAQWKWKSYVHRLGPFIQDRTFEVGAGIGSFTEENGETRNDTRYWPTCRRLRRFSPSAAPGPRLEGAQRPPHDRLTGVSPRRAKEDGMVSRPARRSKRHSRPITRSMRRDLCDLPHLPVGQPGSLSLSRPGRDQHEATARGE